MNICLENIQKWFGKIFAPANVSPLWTDRHNVESCLFVSKNKIAVYRNIQTYALRAVCVVIVLRLRATQRSQKGGRPVIGNGCLLHMTNRTSFFIFFTITVMFELIFVHWENTKKSRAIFQDFHPEKKTFESCFWSGSTEYFEWCFLIDLMKNVAFNFWGLSLLRLVSEKSHLDVAT